MYQHGIFINELDTQMPPAEFSSAGVQVVFGTAPVNLAEEPSKAANTPILCRTLDEVKASIGYSKNCDWSVYTLCQSVFANFEKYKSAPVVFVNVLDPETHKTSVQQTELAVVLKKCTIKDFGIISKSVVVKSSAESTALKLGTDYVQAFDEDGYLTISLLSAGAGASATKLFIAYDKLDPTQVTEDDIIGGVSVDDGSETGIQLVRHVYPKLGVNAGILLAPGWSHKPKVAAALEAKCEKINGCFTSDMFIDIDSSSAGATTKDDVAAQKDAMGITSGHSFGFWPMCKDDGRILYLSAMMAARSIAQDIENNDVPYKSPSNKALDIEDIVLADGTKVMLDFEQAGELNAIGICTAVNRRGFYSWGNNSMAFPAEEDPVKRWMNIRRFFTWWSNDFINTYIDRVDDTANMRLVESIVDDENIKCNGYVSRGYCASAHVEYNAEKTDILNGKIVLKQKLTPYPPAEAIINEVEYDVNELMAAMGGAE